MFKPNSIPQFSFPLVVELCSRRFTKQTILTAFLVMICFGTVHANSASLTVESTSFFNSKDIDYKAWGLTKRDYEKYQVLMKPGTEPFTFYKHLEPAFVLGLYAKSESEKKRYAKLVVNGEKQRHQRLLDFNRQVVIEKLDYEDAFDESLYNEFQSIRSDKIKERLSAKTGSGSSRLDAITEKVKGIFSLSDKKYRPVLAVDTGCINRCSKIVSKLLKQNTQFDVYFAKTPSDDDIRLWATAHKIPVDKVKKGKITLNHSNGILDAYSTRLPLVFSDISLEKVVRY